MVEEEIAYEDVEKLLKEVMCDNNSILVDWKELSYLDHPLLIYC